jgi:hypothetical protein
VKITKNVPTEPGLNAAHDAFEQHGVDEFRDWAEDRGLFDDTTIRVTALAKMLPGIPDTPMGRAWKDAMTQALALTTKDSYRSYDDVDLSEQEIAVLALLDDLASMIAATSPLLAPVAAAIRRHASRASYRALGDLIEKRAEVDERGIMIARWNQDDPSPVIASWEHIEAISEGVRFPLVRLLDSLRAGMPTVEVEDDPGASRTPVTYARS